MKRCWDIIPENRPKFYDLQVDLDHFKMTGDLTGYDFAPLEIQNMKDLNSEDSNSVLERTFSKRIRNGPFSSLIN